MTAVVMIGLNLAVLIGMGILFHRRIENRMKPDQLIRELRDEVNGVIADLNQATDRNVSLIEDRLETLNKTLAKADRAVRVLQREAGRGGESPWRYNDIVRAAPVIRPNPGSGGDRDHTDTPAAPGGGERSETPGAPDEESGRESQPSRDSSAHIDSGNAGVSSADADGRSQPADTAAAGRASPEGAGRSPSKKERILDLHRKGIAANIIAGRVGSTVGEVELVISLAERTE
ncbi:MAG: hypothetical protein ACOCYG_03130 [Spirochaetota bacterium]